MARTIKIERGTRAPRSVARVCSWCHKVFGVDQWELAEGSRSYPSHGMCPSCFKVHMEQVIAGGAGGKYSNHEELRGRACFLDRDGVLIEERNYLGDPNGVVLFPDTVEALRRLSEAGYRLIVVSNQAGVAKGIFPEAAVALVNDRIDQLLRKEGILIDGWYYCPHHPQGRVDDYVCECDCRKPQPGMLLKAAQAHHLVLGECVLIGDKASDLEAGVKAGCKAVVLVRTGHGASEESKLPLGTMAVDSLFQAVDWIREFNK